MLNNVIDFIQVFHRQYLDSESLWRNPFFMELLFWLALVPLVLLLWRWQPDWMARLESAFTVFSRRRVRAVVLTMLLSLGLRLALLPLKPPPVPTAHDEFAYILQAQTFNAGRLTNPPHPLWIHFETMHVNMQPTYQAMYPPGQAAFLALGLRLAGDPWFGVLLGVVLMCGAITWMLQGWMPPQWALLGGLFCVLRFSVSGKWVDSYYGGAVAALGGALLLGAVARIRKREHLFRNGVLFATGAVLMANTRIYEGFMLSLIPGLWLLWWMINEGQTDWRPPLRVLAALLLVLVPAGAFMLYYNYRVTGHPTTMPYMVNQQAYHITRPFLWQDRYPTPAYRHFEMQKFYLFHELPDFLRSRHWWGIREIIALKVKTYYGIFFWPLFMVGMLAAWFALKSPRLRLLPLTGLVLAVAMCLVIWPPEAQYPAPALAVIIALAVLSIRILRAQRLHNVGLGLSRAAVLGVALLLFGSIGYAMWQPVYLEHYTFHIPFQIERARIAGYFGRTADRHLIIVHRSYYSWPGFEWVYNEPDIDASRVVWARDMGDDLNQELIHYFPGRKVWLFDADTRKLTVYRRNVPTGEDLAGLAPSSVATTPTGNKAH